MNPSGGDFGLYVADKIRLLPALHTELGLRWDLQTYAAEPESTLSPRLNLVYALGSRSALRAGWGYFYQPERIFELQIQDGVDTFSPAQRSEHHVLGLEHQFDGGYRLHAAAYRKITEAPRVRFENLFDPLGFFPEADGDRVRIAPDEARAEGLELLFSSPEGGKLSWWGGYTLASVEDHVDGTWVPRSWDQRHTLNLGLSLRPWAGWEFTVAGLYHSGRPTTPVAATSRTLPDGSLEIEPILGPRNSDRLPVYHRLDLRIVRSVWFKGSELRAFLNVTNLLDRKNVCCVKSFDFVPTGNSGVHVQRNDRHGLSRLLTFGVSWTF
jgi:outer membrane receptor protein involved in Fe transport